jgi:hypothetical protein
VALTGDKIGAHRVMMGRPEGNTALGRPRRRWENIIKMYLQQTEWVHGLD